MSNIRFLHDNKLDGATLTERSEVSTLPVENLQNPHRTRVWRTLTDSLEWVEISLDAGHHCKAVALINHNFLDDANLKIRLCGALWAHIASNCPAATCKGFWDWMFKDGTDRSLGLTHLTPHGSAGTPTISWNGDTGMWGFRCYFDRTDSQYWDHADDPDLNLGTGDFTLSGWVKTNYKATVQQLMHKWQTSPSIIGYGWRIALIGKQRLDLETTAGTVNVMSNTDICDNAWHHIAVVVDRNTGLARFYLDGSPDSDWLDISAISSASLDNSASFRLGANLTLGYYFDGNMGVMKLVKEKLSDASIASEAGGPNVIEDLTYDDEIIIKNFTGSNRRFWRLEFNNPDNPDNYIEIGRMFLGNYFEPSRQFARGWEEMLVDPSRIEQSEQGQEWVDSKEKYRMVRVEFPEGAPLSESDRESYREMLQAVGCSKDLFIALDYDNKPNLWSLYGKFAQTEFNFREFLAGLYTTGFDFKESR